MAGPRYNLCQWPIILIATMRYVDCHGNTMFTDCIIALTVSVITDHYPVISGYKKTGYKNTLVKVYMLRRGLPPYKPLYS
jgi:hypothetical protein